MKKLKFIFTLFLFSFTALPLNAQYFSPYGRDIASKKPIGSYNLSVTYNFTYIRDTTNKRRKIDIEKLEIGKEFSRYYSVLAEQQDSSVCNALNTANGKGHSSNMFFYSGQPERYEDIYLNYPKKGTLTCRTELFDTDYEYTESLPHFKWSFKDGFEEIMGYKCKIATTTFRGRSYEVWFTEEIPTTYGPWKFNGLPGLIMKVTDDKGWFIWEATGISQEIGNIYIYDPAYGKTKGHEKFFIKKITRKQLRALQKMEWDDPISIALLHKCYTYKLYKNNGIPTSELVRKEDYASFRTPYIPPLELE
jgi:GLPGLI family protein